MKHLKKKVKNLDVLDIKLMHAGMLFLTLFALRLIGPFMEWTNRQNIWLLLGLAIILFARPCHKFWKK